MIYRSLRDGFGEALLELGQMNPKVVVVTANLGLSIRADAFAKAFPKRYFDVGVAEQNMIGVATGLALEGYTVFALSYACFSPTINFGTIRQSVCLNMANVKIVGSHAGLANSIYGFSHQALEDVALARCLPNMQVLAPIDACEAKLLTHKAAELVGPVYLRLTSPATPVVTVDGQQSVVLREGKDITVLGYGPVLTQALAALDKLPQISAEVINLSSIEPYPVTEVVRSVQKTGKLLCIEDHNVNGGVGELTLRVLHSNGINAFRSILMGVEDVISHTATDYQKIWQHYSLGTKTIEKNIKELFSLS